MMNQCVMVALLALVTGSFAEDSRVGRKSVISYPPPTCSSSFVAKILRSLECNAVISLNATEFIQLQKAKVYCIAGQFGLKDLIDDIKGKRSSYNFRTSEEGRNLEGVSFKDMAPVGRGEEDTDVALLLENRGYQRESDDLRMCIAHEMGVNCLSDLEDWVYDKVEVEGGPIVGSAMYGATECCDDIPYHLMDKYIACVRNVCKTCEC